VEELSVSEAVLALLPDGGRLRSVLRLEDDVLPLPYARHQAVEHAHVSPFGCGGVLVELEL